MFLKCILVQKVGFLKYKSGQLHVCDKVVFDNIQFASFTHTAGMTHFLALCCTYFMSQRSSYPDGEASHYACKVTGEGLGYQSSIHSRGVICNLSPTQTCFFGPPSHLSSHEQQ